MRTFLFISVQAFFLVIFSSTAYGQIERCGTPDPSQTVYGNPLYRITSNTTISVVFHVIYLSDSTGYVPESVLKTQIDVLNEAYSRNGTRYSFHLVAVNWTQNDSWHYMSRGSQAEQDMTNSLAVDPKHTLNIYIGNTGGSFLGWVINYPWEVPEDSNQNGVALHYGSLPGGYILDFNEGDTGNHEVGHYLGLYHTHQNVCQPPGDEVDDTPYTRGNFDCPDDFPDTCPQPGLDPIHNYMNLTNDVCIDEFTPGQCSRMDIIVGQYKPNLGGTTLEFASDFTIPSGRTWKFYSSTLRFAGGIRVNVQGVLLCEGSASDPVMFTSSSASPSPGDWKYIWFNGASSSNSIVDYANIQYAYYGIRINSSEPIIKNCTIENNKYGIRVYDSYAAGDYDNVDFQNNTIKDNTYHGIYLTRSSPTMQANTIKDNSRRGIYAYDSSGPVLSGNTIISNSWSGIRCYKSSSPYIYYKSSKGFGGCNLIKNNGSSSSYHGVYASYNSWPNLGNGSTEPGNNQVYNNTGYEIKNSSGSSIYARRNYWGSPSGPSPSDFSGSVIYIPYLSSPSGTCALRPGSYDLPFASLLEVNPASPTNWLEIETLGDNQIDIPKVIVTTIFGSLFAGQMENPSKDWYIYRGMELYHERKQLDAAMEVFKQLLVGFPNSEEARLALQEIISIMRDLGQQSQIVPFLNELSSTNDGNSLGWYAKLQMVPNLGSGARFPEKLSILESVLEERALEAETRYSVTLQRAMIFSEGLNQKEAAIEAYTNFLASNPPEELALIAENELELLTGIQRTLPKRSVGQSFVDELADEFKLFENHPNPFNSETVIRYILPSDSKVMLGIYDLLGKEIRVLVNSHQVSGSKEIIWDGKDSHGNPVSSGMYLYNIKIRSLDSNKSFSQTRKMVLLR